MNNKRIVFFGGVGNPSQFGGEYTKNKEIVRRLRELGCNVIVLDSCNAGRDKRKLFKIFALLFFNIITHPRSTYLFSTSFKNIYPLFKILYWIPIRLHIIYWVIGGNISNRIESGAYKRKYMEMISLFLMEGVKMKKKMVDLGFNNVWYVPNFKTIGKLPPINKYKDGKIHFIFLSRIIPDKGCDYILDAVASLNKEGLESKYVVDFYGNFEDSYKERFLANVAKHSNVTYGGKLNLLKEENYQVMAQYHYMLFPTYWMGEGFPGVAIDAFKSGVPMIASDWNFNHEFVEEGKTGVTVPTHDVVKLADAMRKAISHDFDNAGMSEICQQRVMDYDTNNVINENLVKVITGKVLNFRNGGGGVKSKFRSFVKSKDSIFTLYYMLTSRDHKEHFAKMKESTAKSKVQIKKERKLYHQYWKCSSIDYVRYGLYDLNLSMDEILDYIPTFVFYTQYLKKKQKGVDESLYSDKWCLYHLFKQNHIPTPEVIAVIDHGKVVTAQGREWSIDELKKQINPTKKYFFKPTNGAGGHGIQVLKNTKPEEIDAFIEGLRKKITYVVQEGLEQRADLSAVNPSSINTLRIVTQYEEEQPRIITGILRMGRNHADVDNNTQGGMSCAINVETGSLNSFATAEHGGGAYYQHPDTGYVFAGNSIKDWDTIKEQVISFATRFPEIKNIGWDIALTVQGLVAIEMNLGFGIEHQQVTCGGMRRRLNVYPKKYE